MSRVDTYGYPENSKYYSFKTDNKSSGKSLTRKVIDIIPQLMKNCK